MSSFVILLPEAGKIKENPLNNLELILLVSLSGWVFSKYSAPSAFGLIKIFSIWSNLFSIIHLTSLG